MQINSEDLKKIVTWSYELTVLMPSPKEYNKKEEDRKKFVIDSRSKFKSLPEALRQMDDAAASITHFVKTAAYFLPRKDAGVKPEQMLPFLQRLLEQVGELNSTIEKPEMVREHLMYLIGYANWNADAVCVILTANNGDFNKSSEVIRKMVKAELRVLGAEDQVNDICSRVEKWVKREDSSRQGGNQNRERNYNRGGYQQRRGY
ncbi:hypothetical protein KHC33_04955 [Methanospirillum sp. J.3.6.1-F.2.7.3]|uniref:Uncharacterized protein n=1 Tax=Methanospirillum purgamenti TaxID=2834276 RepID=A0A8E7EKS6_9EURY|nr:MULTISPECIES: hypothetical protein [Methanospirillum]MDX8551973.1 hypothetical protein [Methanospirillum hungatei]QVV89850.1 hypothetical protein KHC33_04955 [Methanospirillum sp. J.3.6.1-F.2.7.3]